MKTRAAAAFRRFVSATVALSLIPCPFVWAEPAVETNVAATLFADNPRWRDFAASDGAMPKWGPVDANDPIVDADPFFLRSQNWSAAAADAATAGTRVQVEPGAIAIQADGAEFRLLLRQPFLPAFESGDYLFLRAAEPNFFKAKAAEAADYGEGLFFIDKRDLERESEAGAVDGDGIRHGVPIFFLPLEGRGWTGPVEGGELAPDPEHEAIVLSDAEGDTATIEAEDLDELSRAYHYNLFLTVANQLRFDRAAIRSHVERAVKAGGSGRIDLPYALPARGSTADFGMFVSFLDLDDPSHALIQTRAERGLWDFLFPSARATLLTPDVLHRLMVVGGIAGGILVASVVARFTVLSRRSHEVRAHIETVENQLNAQNGRPPIRRAGVLYNFKTASIEVMNIFAQGLTAVDVAPKVTFGYLSEYLADRWMGSSGRLPNGIVRRFLKYTLLYDRQNAEEVLANATTFWRGAVVHGGIDTGLVVVQLLLISPVFFPWAAGLFDAQLQARIAAQFSGVDAATTNVVTSEIMRNASGYLVKGAFDYASDMVGYYLQIIQSEVEGQMRQEGKNPLDPRRRAEFETRLRDRLQALLVERGLPSNDERLFTAPSMIRSAMAGLGYQSLRDLPDHPAASNHERFILEHERQGILFYALDRAIKEAREMRRLRRDPTTQHVVEILVGIRKDLSLLRGLILERQSLPEVWEKAKAMRQILTTMSYTHDGEFQSAAIHHVDLWPGFAADPRAAELSARLFRQALFSVLDDRPYYLRPTPAQTARYFPEAMEEAGQRLRSEGEVAFDEFDQRIVAAEIVKEKIGAEEHRNLLEEWQPPQPKWKDLDFGTTTRQLNRIHRKAIRAVARSLKIDPQDLFDNENIIIENHAEEIYQTAVRHAWTREVGIYTYATKRSTLMPLALQEANEKIEGAMRSPIIQHYLGRFSEVERMRTLAQMGAEAFVEKYVELTVSNSRTISLASPEQPGIFQRLRQLRVATRPDRVGRTVTLALRILETPWPNNSYSLGGKAWRHRNIPFLRDLSTAVRNRSQTIFGAVTASYLANYYIWQAKFPWPVYLFLVMNATVLSQAKYLLDRFMMNIDKPPMDSNRRIAAYGVIWSFLSYPLFIPFYFYNQEFAAGFDRYFATPVQAGFASVRQLCEMLLSF